MDFFSHQDRARRKTKYLVLLFLTAVALLVLLANVIIAFVLWMSSSGSDPDFFSFFSWDVFILVCLVVNFMVGMAILYKWIRISGGGKNVAESMDGIRILPNSEKLEERRLLNVVEEMAIAAGMPVPPVYLLANEKGINAFAAGNTPADAVIGVTRGCLERLKREQLQGVVAHEFSHILNGDMRLNMRLIAILNGILFLGACGRFFMRIGRFSSSSSRRSGGGQLMLFGLAMALIGWIGTFFGGLIKAAINRQREFLADASAVQFTRNPDGIAGALKVIGGLKLGSKVAHLSADEISHMFISNALSHFSMFRTHPPLEDRIRRIDPGWDGKMIVAEVGHVDTNDRQEKQAPRMGTAASVASAAVIGSILGRAANAIPESLEKKVDGPFSASALLYALLLDEEEEVRQEQLKIVGMNAAKGSDEMSRSLYKEIKNVDPTFRITLVEKAMPALKWMSEDQYRTLRKCMKKLIHADRKIELFEWCLFQLVRHYLGAEFGDQRPSKPQYKTIDDIGEHFTVVTSTLIHHCHQHPETAEKAFVRGANTAGLCHAALLPLQDCTMDRFIRGVAALADSYPLLKARVLRGLVNVVEFDRVVTPMEKELITSIAAVMDSPIPRLQSIGGVQ